METTLNRIFCLIAAVALTEAKVEPELVARIIAAEDVTAEDANPTPLTHAVHRIAWSKLRGEAEVAVARHGLIVAPPV